MRLIAFSLALAVIILPASFNYYFSRDGDNRSNIASTEPLEIQDFGDITWTGPVSTPATSDHNSMSMSSVTARLEAKLNQNPDDIGGWILLGRSYVALGQPERAISIFEKKIEEFPKNNDLLLSYGETLADISGGNITDKAAEMFKKAYDIDPANPRAGYNLALYEIQQGQSSVALERLNELLKLAPEGAAWTAQVKEKISALNGGLTISNTMKQPTSEQINQVNSMSPDDRSNFIRSMVDGLAAQLAENPDNLDGWLNLGRSYGVLNEWQKSADAYQNALKLSPDDEKIKSRLIQAQKNIP